MAPPKIPLETRLSRWTNRDTDTGCWMWTGKLDHAGYAHIKYSGKDQKTATVVYEFYKGPIPAGLEVSHICPGGGNPACVNPDHLIAETHSENLKRRRPFPKYKGFVCKRGHPLEGVKLASNGGCPICEKARVKAWKDARPGYAKAYREANWNRIEDNRRARRARLKEE